MQSASSKRKRSVGKLDVASSNLTSSHFLGTTQRSWMTQNSVPSSSAAKVGGSVAKVSSSKLQHQGSPHNSAVAEALNSPQGNKAAPSTPHSSGRPSLRNSVEDLQPQPKPVSDVSEPQPQYLTDHELTSPQQSAPDQSAMQTPATVQQTQSTQGISTFTPPVAPMHGDPPTTSRSTTIASTASDLVGNDRHGRSQSIQQSTTHYTLTPNQTVISNIVGDQLAQNTNRVPSLQSSDRVCHPSDNVANSTLSCAAPNIVSDNSEVVSRANSGNYHGQDHQFDYSRIVCPPPSVESQLSGAPRPNTAHEHAGDSQSHLLTPLASPTEQPFRRNQSLPSSSSKQAPPQRPKLPVPLGSQVYRLPSSPQHFRIHNQHPASVVIPWPSPDQETNIQHPQQTSQTKHRSSYLIAFESILAEMKQRHVHLQTAASVSRITWVREACTVGDNFFLLLSQLHCMWSRQLPLLADKFGIGPEHELGFRAVEAVAGASASLPPEFLDRLTAFPFSFHTLVTNQEVSEDAKKIAALLRELGRLWPSFLRSCLTRQIPPSPYEIASFLNSQQNLVLPRALFWHIECKIHPQSDSRWDQTVRKFFYSIQAEYLSQSKDLQRQNADMRSLLEMSNKQNSNYLALRQDHLEETRVPHRSMNGADPATLSSQPDEPRSSLAPNNQMPGRVEVYPANAANSHQQPQLSGQPLLPSQHPPNRQFVHASHYQMPSIHTGFPSSNQMSVQTHGNAIRPTRHQHQFQGDNNTAPVNILLERSGYLHMNDRATSVLQTGIELTHSHRVRPNVTPNAAQQATRVLANAAQMIPSGSTNRLLPDLNAIRPPVANPNPLQMALHQAHVAPFPAIVEGQSSNASPLKLFQYIKGFVLEPYRLSAALPYEELNFTVGSDLFDRHVRSAPPKPGDLSMPGRRFVQNGATLFHLRCIRVTKEEQAVDEHEWASSPTAWPSHCFISVNEQHLEIRRKRQHKQDQPVDITEFVHAGMNQVALSIHVSYEDRDMKFAIAIEAIELSDYNTALKLPRFADAHESRNHMVASLTSNSGDDDGDELMVLNAHFSIDLIDPFASQLVQMPVRGSQCKHRECFDLDTYLQSRTSETGDGLTRVYGWLCPLCKKDARPSALIIDGFLLEVVDALRSSHQNDAKAIVVRDDGTWEPRFEQTPTSTRNSSPVTDENQDPCGSRPEPKVPTSDQSLTPSGLPTPQRESSLPHAQLNLPSQQGVSFTAEVIELDDDD